MLRGGTPSGGWRGQSGIIGAVIVMVFVFGLAMLVLLGGQSAVSDIQEERTEQSARVVMEGVDADLSTLTSGEQSATGQFALGDLEGHEARLVRNGFLNVTVNRNSTCSTNMTLSSIRYESPDGETVAYEAGGVWINNANENGSAMQTPPDVRFRNGSLDVTIANLTGDVGTGTNQAFYNATRTDLESRQRTRAVVVGDCALMNNVTMNVTSDFATAWESYLRDEFDADESGIEVTRDGRTVSVYINQSQLPRRVDQSRNRVINMSNASYMANVSISNNSIRVSKNTSQEYNAFVTALSENRVDIGQIRTINQSTNVTGPPRDVIFVLDESGSMGNDDMNCDSEVGWWYDDTRICAAQEAIQNFVGSLNESRDRVGLVGYSSDENPFNGDPVGPSWKQAGAAAWVYQTNGELLTNSFDDFNQTVLETEDRSNTFGSAGLNRANIAMHLASNQTRQQIIIFLSDGQFNGELMDGEDDPNQAARIRAQTTGEQGATLYTIGFGDSGDIDEPVLTDMAEATGGEYYFAANANELNQVLENIATRIAQVNLIARTPTSTNLTSGAGDTLSPQIAGNTDDIATVTQDGEEFMNINDPTAPTQFTHSFALADNESIIFNASTYDCAEWRGTGIYRSHNGSTYQVSRCAEMTTVDDTIGPTNTSVYLDGDNMTDLLEGEDPAWWQQSIRQAIDARSDVTLNSSNFVSMPSNTAIIVFDYPNGTSSTNRLALLYQLGLSEGQASPEGVINISVNDVRVDG